MKYILILSVLLLCELAKSQSLGNADSVSIYINRLSWNSFAIAGTYVAQFGLREDAKRIIEIKDKTKIKKLLDSIGVEQKTVVIHMILSRMLEPQKTAFGEYLNYGKDSTTKSVDFSFNGIKWTMDMSGKNSISEKEINRVRQYWRRKCHLK
jgi:hypothetical protein